MNYTKLCKVDAGLDINHYPPLQYKLFLNAFFDKHKFAQWQAIDNQEKLQTAITQFVKDNPATYDNYLHFLVGGLHLSNGQILKIVLAEDDVKQEFENKVFIFNNFRNPISLDEFFQDR